MHNRSDVCYKKRVLQEENEDEENLDDSFPVEDEMPLSDDSENDETDDDQW